MNKVAGALGCVGVIILIALITVAGYLGGWWLQSDVTNRQAHIDRQNYGSQLAYVNKVSDNMAEIASIDTQVLSPSLDAGTKAGLNAQKVAIVNTTCKTYHLIVDPPADEASWAAGHCG
jgi:hypothetical protein